MTVAFTMPGRQTLTQQVVTRIADRILSRTLAAGDALPTERELADQLGVSKMVIRESLRVLAALGLVEVRHGVGTFVSGPAGWRIEQPIMMLLHVEQQSLLDWLEIRVLIEAGFARLAAQRATAEDLAAIMATITRLRTSVNDLDAGIQADLDFHYAVAHASGNALARTMMRVLLQPIREYLLDVIRAQMPRTFERTIGSHLQVYEAIAARDPDRAEAEMRTHLKGTNAEVQAAYRTRAMPTVAPLTGPT